MHLNGPLTPGLCLDWVRNDIDSKGCAIYSKKELCYCFPWDESHECARRERVINGNRKSM